MNHRRTGPFSQLRTIARFAIDERHLLTKIPIGMALLRKLFWLAVFLISTLCFVVLFEKGTVDFPKNLSKQIEEFHGFVSEQISPKKNPAP